MSKIIGIDPGFDRIGYAVGEKEGSRLKILSCGLIQTDRTQTIFSRYQQIMTQLEKVVVEWQPAVCHIEKIFFSKNQKTAMQVSEARGVILELLIRHQVAIKEFSPQEIKLAVTGYGNADKLAMAKMIKMQVIPSVEIKWQDDVVDAMGLLLAI